MFSPKEVEPMVWPSAEAARNLLNDFNALPDFVKKNETTLESFLKEKTCKVHEKLKKTQKENMERMVYQLMVQPSWSHKFDDLDVKEIYSLISFTKDAIMHLRKKVGSVQHCPLRDPPVYPFEEQVKENERAMKTYEEVNMVNSGGLKEKQSYYLMDEWIFPSLEPLSSQDHQQIMMNMASYNNTLDPRSYHPYQGSSSNGDNNLEMEPTFSPMLAFPDFVEPVYDQYSFDFMSHEDQSNIYKNNYPVNGFCPEPPPPGNGGTAEEGNFGASSFDLSYMDWPGINNHHF
ncbi:unnamed protein product [Eruca vesicaria subsp. sativa]|uniref:Uncharacterized protein n=1 Tax=Eruca vesicaria subsp. sativa TaxID=29727 RepID=A0ABC8KL56_ERUVS|nr:unnamed protein product [Eruca vesicaria subsp. sativa]